MREILFRGLRTDGQGWAYGMLIQSFEGIHIIESDSFKPSNGQSPELIDIMSETIGQYTGLTDKNGVKIFEDDLLKDDRSHGDFSDDIIQVKFVNGVFCYPNYGILSNLNEVNWYSEVIGNIHENK